MHTDSRYQGNNKDTSRLGTILKSTAFDDGRRGWLSIVRKKYVIRVDRIYSCLVVYGPSRIRRENSDNNIIDVEND